MTYISSHSQVSFYCFTFFFYSFHRISLSLYHKHFRHRSTWVLDAWEIYILHSTALGNILFLKAPWMWFCAENPLLQGTEVRGIVWKTCARVTNEGNMSLWTPGFARISHSSWGLSLLLLRKCLNWINEFLASSASIRLSSSDVLVYLSISLSRFLVPWFQIPAAVQGNLAGLRMGLKSFSTCTSFSGNLSFAFAILLSMKLSLIPLKQFFVPDWSLWFLCVHNHLCPCGTVAPPSAHQDFLLWLWLWHSYY